MVKILRELRGVRGSGFFISFQEILKMKENKRKLLLELIEVKKEQELNW